MTNEMICLSLFKTNGFFYKFNNIFPIESQQNINK